MRDLRVFNFILIRNSVNIFVEKKIFARTINCLIPIIYFLLQEHLYIYIYK